MQADNNNATEENLKDAGCGSSVIEQFFKLGREHRKNDQLRLLAGHRQALTQNLHLCQKNLDCLDYLVYQMKKD